MLFFFNVPNNLSTKQFEGKKRERIKWQMVIKFIYTHPHTHTHNKQSQHIYAQKEYLKPSNEKNKTDAPLRYENKPQKKP